jgi:hypothetical protein
VTVILQRHATHEFSKHDWLFLAIVYPYLDKEAPALITGFSALGQEGGVPEHPVELHNWREVKGIKNYCSGKSNACPLLQVVD